MRVDRPLIALLMLFPGLVAAAQPGIDAHADLLYRQALPFLEKADAQSSALSMEKGPTDLELVRQVQALARTLEPAVGLLQKAAALKHPVAEYRLALHYITYLPMDRIAPAVCPLLESSIRQGFAPAALGIATWCTDYSDTDEYRQALEYVQMQAPRYAGYYPQPAVRLECKREIPRGLAMQWGGQRDFQAEVYRLLGAKDRAHRQSYLEKAVEINGCYGAQRRLVQVN